MLKYVQPNFQISDLKQEIWLSLYADVELEATFKKVNVESNNKYIKP